MAVIAPAVPEIVLHGDRDAVLGIGDHEIVAISTAPLKGQVRLVDRAVKDDRIDVLAS